MTADATPPEKPPEPDFAALARNILKLVDECHPFAISWGDDLRKRIADLICSKLAAGQRAAPQQGGILPPRNQAWADFLNTGPSIESVAAATRACLVERAALEAALPFWLCPHKNPDNCCGKCPEVLDKVKKFKETLNGKL